ncbi:hypothetical protein MKX01_032012 [Papaver californicum]|nr:hypothetical protein MKX01_032012 [Papaver californicum]
MADTDVETDLDFAFTLQVEEAMAASLIGDEQEIFQNVSYLQTLELLKKGQQMKDDLKRLIHDQEVAKEISRIPVQEWEKNGDHFQKPYGEGSSSNDFHNNKPFKLYFKGLFSNERVGDTVVEIAGIGFVVCDPLGNSILNGVKPLVGDWKSDFAPEVLELKVEVKALIEGLTAAYSLDIKRIDFYCDFYPLYQYISMRHLVNQQYIATVVNQVSLLQRNFISCRHIFVVRNDVNTSRTMKETCNICLEDISVRQFFTVKSFSHLYCCSCMRQHVEVKLLNGVVPRCPYDGCKTMLNLDNCKQFMTPKLIDMMSKRIKEDSIPITEKVYCPNPKCSNLMSKTNIPKCVYNQSTSEYLCGKCMKCDGYFCFKCKVPWHNGMTSEAYQAQKASEDDLWRQCKECNHMIELVWVATTSLAAFFIFSIENLIIKFELMYINFHGSSGFPLFYLSGFAGLSPICWCSHEFCYTCGAVWINKKATCDCPIWDERNLLHIRDKTNRTYSKTNITSITCGCIDVDGVAE